MGGSNEGLHKHLASEDWAGDISRPRMKDWDGPHHVCTNHTSCDSSRLYRCFVNVDKKELYCTCLFVCVDNRMKTNFVLFFSSG